MFLPQVEQRILSWREIRAIDFCAPVGCCTKKLARSSVPSSCRCRRRRRPPRGRSCSAPPSSRSEAAASSGAGPPSRIGCGHVLGPSADRPAETPPAPAPPPSARGGPASLAARAAASPRGAPSPASDARPPTRAAHDPATDPRSSSGRDPRMRRPPMQTTSSCFSWRCPFSWAPRAEAAAAAPTRAA